MPEKATMMMAGVETKPADTAASPKTSAPTIESAMPTYLGIRTLASFKTSKTRSTKNISRLGDNGSPWMLLAMVSVSPKGMSCILKSWDVT